MILKELAENLGVGEEIFIKLVGTWLEVFDEDVKKLEDIKTSGNYPEIRIIAHRIKGSSVQMGFSRIAEVALAAERKAAASSVDGIDESIEELKNLRREIAELGLSLKRQPDRKS